MPLWISWVSIPLHAEEAIQSANGIIAILDDINKAGIRSNVSIKLTQIGMGMDDKLCIENLTRILESCPPVWKFRQDRYRGFTLYG